MPVEDPEERRVVVEVVQDERRVLVALLVARLVPRD